MGFFTKVIIYLILDFILLAGFAVSIAITIIYNLYISVI